MSYENKKKAQARMTAYWEKRRAEEAVARLRLEGEPVAVVESPVIQSCRNRSDQTFCNDLDCGKRDSDGKHWPAGHPMNIPGVAGIVMPASELPVSAVSVPPARTSSRSYQIIANSDGMMVCENGPCLCGKGKREWHSICLKENR